MKNIRKISNIIYQDLQNFQDSFKIDQAFQYSKLPKTFISSQDLWESRIIKNSKAREAFKTRKRSRYIEFSRYFETESRIGHCSRGSRDPFDKLSPLGIHIYEGLPRRPGLTDNQARRPGEKGARGTRGGSLGVPENPLLLHALRGVRRGPRCRNVRRPSRTNVSWNETRKRWEVGGVARDLASVFFPSRLLRREEPRRPFGVCGDGEFAVIKPKPRQIINGSSALLLLSRFSSPIYPSVSVLFSY